MGEHQWRGAPEHQWRGAPEIPWWYWTTALGINDGLEDIRSHTGEIFPWRVYFLKYNGAERRARAVGALALIGAMAAIA